MTKTYFDTKEKNLCCGCKVCSSVCPVKAISFQNDEEGFWYPIIDEKKCIKCNKCRTVCPLAKNELDKIKEENQTYAAYSKSKEVLDNSTSGGIFTHLSDLVLESGGVIFGHKYDKNMKCVCVVARTKEDRNIFRGSKYVQSDMGEVYKQIKTEIELNKIVLVTGTPCQIDAVRSYFSYKLPENLVTMDIVCHGVPSPQIFAEYVEFVEKKEGKKIVNFKFRDKQQGWTTPFRVFEYSDGTTNGELLNADAFNNLFQGTDCILRPSCYNCRYAGKQRISDISIADFWGIQNKHNDMFNENKGVSLLLLNTEKGKTWFKKIQENQTMKIKNVALLDAQERNYPLLRPTSPYFDRNKFFIDYQKRGLEYCLKKYCSRSFFSRLRRKIRRIIKTKVLK